MGVLDSDLSSDERTTGSEVAIAPESDPEYVVIYIMGNLDPGTRAFVRPRPAASASCPRAVAFITPRALGEEGALRPIRGHNYPVTPDRSPGADPRCLDELASHENARGSLVLGHASIITSFPLSPDER